ncbi:uncharacterized protein LOC119082251 [Bradysia coprophila]|uniref:uncharacterized protein LOC119082251 n=1 Tax=Bradysia coprophila TaxID=38358 RepID=UPI00187DB60D|nr:uncharacterized protein LOC119082251 [Bradysia coprophila]XP_037047614.1 uncharacterized protein LOC119082251 [Bradysia coprophila]
MSLMDTTRLVLKSLVLSSPEPLTIEQLDRDYEKQEGRRIPFSKLGHANLKSFLLSMPDILAYNSSKRTLSLATQEGGKSEHILKLVSGQKTGKKRNHNSKSFNHSNNSNHFNNNGQNREIKIWDTHPLNHNQPNYNSNYNRPNYNTNYNQPNNNAIYSQTQYNGSYQTLAFEPGNLLSPPSYIRGSLLGVPPLPLMRLAVPCPAMPVTNQTTVPRHDLNGRPKTFNKFKQDAPKKNSTTNGERAPNKKLNDDPDTLDGTTDSNSEEVGALPPMDDDDPIKFIGSKMMSSKYGRNIPLATMPKTLKPGHVQQIFVTEVTNFPYFFFQLAGSDETMRGLQEELNLTYDDNNAVEPAEMIRRSEIQIGHVCAAFYANKWSRAEILSHDDDRLKLLFVDYGTIDYVSIEDTRYLYADVCEIPRLCHRGALAFLEPLRNNQLEQKIIKIFCEMVADRSLIAVFSSVHESDHISMTLVDTSDKKADLIINKSLMESL